jgi:hypothetical protein
MKRRQIDEEKAEMKSRQIDEEKTGRDRKINEETER